jgi:hypothetical protein
VARSKVVECMDPMLNLFIAPIGDFHRQQLLHFPDELPKDVSATQSFPNPAEWNTIAGTNWFFVVKT